MATPVGAEHRDLEQRFRNLERGQSDLVSATFRRQPVKADSVQVDVNSLATTPDGQWVQQPYTDMAVPDGYSRAVVQLFAAAGANFTGAGNIGVQPVVSTGGTIVTGPPISSGQPGAAPVSVSSNANLALSNLGTTVRIGVIVQHTGPVAAGSMNYHISALVLFLR